MIRNGAHRSSLVLTATAVTYSRYSYVRTTTARTVIVTVYDRMTGTIFMIHTSTYVLYVRTISICLPGKKKRYIYFLPYRFVSCVWIRTFRGYFFILFQKNQRKSSTILLDEHLISLYNKNKITCC